MVDGPLPTHYEPIESPVENLLYPKQQNSPVLKRWEPDDQLAPMGDANFPYVLTTYRLTEHHLSGVMSRWLPWLAELQPELFAEIHPDLAREIGVGNTEFVRVITPRGEIRAKALVTRRLAPMQGGGEDDPPRRVALALGLPGGGDRATSVNDLTSLVGDPNVSIHEGQGVRL
jgi:formate dehydrogenase major subunit